MNQIEFATARTLLRTTCFLMALAGSGWMGAWAQATATTLLVDVDHRTTTSLNGNWHYLVDAGGLNLYGLDGIVRDKTYAQDRHPVLVGERAGSQEYDFATAPTLKVPGDWNTQQPTLFRFEGVVWYEREFAHVRQDGMRTYLHIGAANYRSYLWVNGKRICQHEGGFTPFDCEVTGAVLDGKNSVVIAVDSTRQADGIPSPSYDWFNYGGITRDVSLLDVPTQFMDDYDIHLSKGATDELSGYVHVEGAGSGVPVRLQVAEAGLDVTSTTDEKGKAAFRVTAKNLALWSPENPKLYRVNLTAGADQLTDEIGFRTLRVEGTRILLNGKPIFLRGVCVHAEAMQRPGIVNSDADVEAIFASLHDLHANFARLVHYPHDERMTRAADKNGILIWSEIPVWQQVAYSNPKTFALARTLLRDMVRRDRNKASVIIWSVANETPDRQDRTEFLSMLAEEARALDPTRLIAAAFLQPNTEGKNKVLTDPLAAALDVVGQNEYIGWYSYVPSVAESISFTLPQKPVIISEFGAEAKSGNHASAEHRWTEDFQLDFYKHNFNMLANIPQIRGYAPWVLKDFRSPNRNIPALQDGFNRKGLISEDGERKLSFTYIQKIYAEGLYGKAE
jgi:beta-glucuronidase